MPRFPMPRGGHDGRPKRIGSAELDHLLEMATWTHMGIGVRWGDYPTPHDTVVSMPTHEVQASPLPVCARCGQLGSRSHYLCDACVTVDRRRKRRQERYEARRDERIEQVEREQRRRSRRWALKYKLSAVDHRFVEDRERAYRNAREAGYEAAMYAPRTSTEFLALVNRICV